MFCRIVDHSKLVWESLELTQIRQLPRDNPCPKFPKKQSTLKQKMLPVIGSIFLYNSYRNYFFPKPVGLPTRVIAQRKPIQAVDCR